MNLILSLVLAGGSLMAGPNPMPQMPGQVYAPPAHPTAANAPLVYSHTTDAGPDQSFLLVGEGLTDELTAWGVDPKSAGGAEIKPRVQMSAPGSVVATIPLRAYEGPIVVWAKNKAGASEPVVLNAPELWWCRPEVAQPNEDVAIFGRNLSQRPDYSRALVYLAQPGKQGVWLKTRLTGKYRVNVELPAEIEPGEYQLWIHAGNGGEYGWGGPLPLHIRATSPAARDTHFQLTDGTLQQAVDRLAPTGGTIELGKRTVTLSETLIVPANVHVEGAGPDKTFLVLSPDAKPSDRLPGNDRAVVWLAGDHAAISGLTVRGTSRTNLGVVIRSPKWPDWVHDCSITDVHVCGHEGKQAENCGVRLFHADDASLTGNEFWGRTPIFMSGVQRCEFTGNRLISQTLFGGNSEAYILGRNNTVRKCIIEDNVCACPPGSEAGGPTGRRLLWFSTGRGSVDLNWISDNREERARFGGLSGEDQNVGETILFEACERTAYYGQAVGADQQSVTLPATLPETPAKYLMDVRRDTLAHDAAGNETPFWPPEVNADEKSLEPTVGEYFVTILGGRGQGQTRRVIARQDQTYRLDRPWRVAPERGSLILVHTAFWRNHIVENRAVDGMSGIQLWITCIENIISGNQVARMRGQGVYLYGSCTNLASSMPATWNRGIGPLYFNQVESTRTDETRCGVAIGTGERGQLPVEFPRCLGNVLRYNSLIRNRDEGVLVAGGRSGGERQPSPVTLGTIAEFNVVRDATTGYHVGGSAEMTLLRRNHAYFWYPVTLRPGPRIGFQIDSESAAAALEQNTVESSAGVANEKTVVEQRGGSRPARNR